MKHISKLHGSQKGMVSFLVTMIMMMVITLIVVGFTQVVNQNRRDALDRQLSTQAYYAAESGVNDAMAKIDDILSGNPTTPLPTVTDCRGAAGSYGLSSSTLSDGVSYSCLLIDPINNTLEYSDIKTDMPTVIPLRAVDANGVPQSISSLTLSWAAKEGPNSEISGCYSGGGGRVYDWPKDWPGNCDFGVLRTEVFRPNTGDITNGQSFTFFARPKSGGSSTLRFTNNASTAVLASCTGAGASRMCSTTVESVNSSLLYLRANTIYVGSQKLIVKAMNAAGQPLFFIGQIKIDATGKAQDVLRRIQVRYSPQGNPAENPVSAVMGDNKICKRFAVGPTTYQDLSTVCDGATEEVDPNARPLPCQQGDPGCPKDDKAGSNPDAVLWERLFRNGSPNDPALVDSCVWDWGDGTEPGRTACQQGQSIKHKYVHPYKGLKCYTATVTLSVKLTNNKSKVGKIQQKVPYGMGADEYCDNRWPPA